MKTRSVMLIALLCVPWMAGCPPTQPKLAGSGMDMFGPVSLRVHPLSRLQEKATPPYLEGRVELTDQFGDTGKGVGRLTWVAKSYTSPVPGMGSEISRWSIDLNDPANNGASWDKITRTYLCKLPWTGAKEEKIELEATLELPNGHVLKGSAVVTAGGGK